MSSYGGRLEDRRTSKTELDAEVDAGEVWHFEVEARIVSSI